LLRPFCAASAALEFNSRASAYFYARDIVNAIYCQLDAASAPRENAVTPAKCADLTGSSRCEHYMKLHVLFRSFGGSGWGARYAAPVWNLDPVAALRRL
jgi:hypothetical protein